MPGTRSADRRVAGRGIAESGARERFVADGELDESLVDRLLAGAFQAAPPAAPVPADDVPAHLSDRYRIEGVIGRGGVGIVLRGRDLELGRDVALKVLRKEHVGHEGLKRRFL